MKVYRAISVKEAGNPLRFTPAYHLQEPGIYQCIVCERFATLVPSRTIYRDYLREINGVHHVVLHRECIELFELTPLNYERTATDCFEARYEVYSMQQGQLQDAYTDISQEEEGL